jgi:Lysozyme like domain
MPSATATSNLSYAQLKGVWLDASKGTRYHTNHWASLMAAIAEAESHGNPIITNPVDDNGKQTSWGLWQISTGDHSSPSPNWADPAVNAKLAIGKLNDQGLGAWSTYNSGAYKAFLSDKTTPDYTLTNAPSAAEQGQATDAAEGQQACAWSVRWGGIAFGIGAGQVCVLSKSQARFLIGGALLVTGGLITVVGLNWILIAAAGPKIVGLAVSAIAPEAGAAKAATRGTAKVLGRT